MGIRLSVLSLMPMLLLLQACDGTPFGQRLSESFDSQSGEVSPEAARTDPNDNDSELSVMAEKSADPDKQQDSLNDKARARDNEDANPKANPKANAEEGDTKTTSREQPSAVVAIERPDPRPLPERTRPYRIIIRLSAADPAAPAEGVTDALRRAGIGFEVETIEKVPLSGLNQPSNLQKKPAS